MSWDLTPSMPELSMSRGASNPARRSTERPPTPMESASPLRRRTTCALRSGGRKHYRCLSSRGENGDAVTAEVDVRALAPGHGQDQRLEWAFDTRALSVVPRCVGGA